MQAKPETVDKVCGIVRKQLALKDDVSVTGESKFASLGADSLDTVLHSSIMNFCISGLLLNVDQFSISFNITTLIHLHVVCGLCLVAKKLRYFPEKNSYLA